MPPSISVRRRGRGRSHWRRGGKRRGVSVVEFAIVANLMFATVFICVEFTRLNMIRNLTQDAAYFAARAAMVPGATEDDAIEEAERILSILDTQEAVIEVNGGAGVGDETKELRVQITVPIGPNALFVSAFTGDKNFKATAMMKTERYDGFYTPQ